MPTPTPTQEDYLKAIWTLIQRKGYARVSDIADLLGVSHASVSRMVRRLHEDDLTTYERYRGLNLTAAGRQRGRMLVERQRILGQWLEAMGLARGPELDRTLEGIEHHFAPEALSHVESLVRYIAAHPAWWREYLDGRTPIPVVSGRRRERARPDGTDEPDAPAGRRPSREGVPQ